MNIDPNGNIPPNNTNVPDSKNLIIIIIINNNYKLIITNTCTYTCTCTRVSFFYCSSTFSSLSLTISSQGLVWVQCVFYKEYLLIQGGYVPI